LYKLMDDKAEALEFAVRADCGLVDVPLKDLTTKPNTLIAGIFRNKKTIIPSGNDTIQVGDKVVVLTAGHRIGNLSDILA
ncbi:MAG: Trk system potassium transporter TrkA, partial [Clostridia bacterium]|nr:Trk system potassium transporter TrkA [Clostridia bacterium]